VSPGAYEGRSKVTTRKKPVSSKSVVKPDTARPPSMAVTLNVYEELGAVAGASNWKLEPAVPDITGFMAASWTS